MAKKKTDYDIAFEKTKDSCDNSNGGINVEGISFSKPKIIEAINKDLIASREIITDEKVKEIFSQPVKKGLALSWGIKNKK